MFDTASYGGLMISQAELFRGADISVIVIAVPFDECQPR